MSPEVGFDVVILKRKKEDPGPETIDFVGHVGFFAGWENYDTILLLGGNQSDSVSISPYPTSKMLGVRRLLV